MDIITEPYCVPVKITNIPPIVLLSDMKVSSCCAVVFKLAVLTSVISNVSPQTLRGQRTTSEVVRLEVEIMRASSSSLLRSDGIMGCHRWEGGELISSRAFVL